MPVRKEMRKLENAHASFTLFNKPTIGLALMCLIQYLIIEHFQDLYSE